jgi:hypothetical protein
VTALIDTGKVKNCEFLLYLDFFFNYILKVRSHS